MGGERERKRERERERERERQPEGVSVRARETERDREKAPAHLMEVVQDFCPRGRERRIQQGLPDVMPIQV